MFTDMFGNRCEICPMCGKITVEVKTDVVYLCCPPRPQVQQRCGCGWVGEAYPGDLEAEPLEVDWMELWEFVNSDPFIQLRAALGRAGEALRTAWEPFRQAIDQVLASMAEHFHWIEAEECEFEPAKPWPLRQARKRWRRRMMWEHGHGR